MVQEYQEKVYCVKITENAAGTPMGVSVALLLLSASNVLQKWCLRLMFWGNSCISAIECCEFANPLRLSI